MKPTKQNRKERPMPDFFDPNEQPPGQPRISDSGLAYYKSLLGNEKWVADNPAQASFLKASVDDTLAATGQNFKPPADNRTPAQRLHDQRFGVKFAPDGNVVLPDVLAAVIQRDAAGSAPDPAVRDASLKAAGIDPGNALVSAQAALDKAGLPARAEKLSANTLAALSALGAHLQKHATNRPQS